MAAPRNSTFGLDIDYASYVRSLYAIGRQALPKAAAATLNRAAFAAQRELTAHVREAFDKPKPFTEKSFIVQKAAPRRWP
ncbi:hypothetical protein VQ042_20620 [Aurantimonas sp. A2-1-M11]|uniref:hypothetical protein n=1 Tax=Aurantimonas sp. A2-1-M11 TaxID=3113712 RepID=UPI002F9291D7